MHKICHIIRQSPYGKDEATVFLLSFNLIYIYLPYLFTYLVKVCSQCTNILFLTGLDTSRPVRELQCEQPR